MTTAKKPVVKKPAHPRKPRVTKPKTEHAAGHVAADKPNVKLSSNKTFYAVGRRKTAVAQILLTVGNGTITINKLPFENYFQTSDLQYIVRQPMVMIGQDNNLDIRAKIHGGGIHAQAESLRHAIARAIIQLDPETRRTVKKQGFLTRDPRVKERKKPGLKRARRAPQFSKR